MKIYELGTLIIIIALVVASFAAHDVIHVVNTAVTAPVITTAK